MPSSSTSRASIGNILHGPYQAIFSLLALDLNHPWTLFAANELAVTDLRICVHKYESEQAFLSEYAQGTSIAAVLGEGRGMGCVGPPPLFYGREMFV